MNKVNSPVGWRLLQYRGPQMIEPSPSPARTLSKHRISASVTAYRYSVYEAYLTRQTASAECSAWRPMAWTPSMRFASTRLAAGGPVIGWRRQIWDARTGQELTVWPGTPAR
jgi:hypothetical protein